jgi:acyl carrier protein
VEHDLFGKPVPTFPDHAQAACKQRYSEKQSIVLDRSNESVADRVAALVRKVLEREEINKRVGPDDDLRASGLSSLGLVNLMLSVETEFDLKIPERDMTPTNFRSIMRIAELVDTLSQTSPATA